MDVHERLIYLFYGFCNKPADGKCAIPFLVECYYCVNKNVSMNVNMILSFFLQIE